MVILAESKNITDRAIGVLQAAMAKAKAIENGSQSVDATVDAETNIMFNLLGKYVTSLENCASDIISI
ncbi:hypothetical protein EUX98_g4075 [Antrodiella citrinella]|uniref:Uncharacterized protein n=1 Tax=Antrodiella citrinella TaxID=2447956 RepID=A0A4S4MX01_9APHY|nr:hypothetical protein EUX98_g4075 [Antrodiella citrinella]